MMLQITTRKIDVYEVNVADEYRKFKTLCELNRIEKKRTTMLRDKKNRGKWKIDVVDKLIIAGRDGVVRAVILRVYRKEFSGTTFSVSQYIQWSYTVSRRNRSTQN